MLLAVVGQPALGAASAAVRTSSGVALVPGDLVMGTGGGTVDEFDSAGTLLGTLQSGRSNLQTPGLCDAPGTAVYAPTWNDNVVSQFDWSGNVVSAAWASSPGALSCDVAPNGTVYVGSWASGSLLSYSSAGTQLASKALPHPVDWIRLAPDGCTLYYTDYSPNVYRYNVCTNVALSDFADNVPTDAGATCYQPETLPGGGLLLPCGEYGLVDELSASGAVVATFSGLAGGDTVETVAASLDGSTFWVDGYTSGTLEQVALASGDILASEVAPITNNGGGLRVLAGFTPSAPTGVTASAGDAEAEVSWSAPALGASTVTSDTVTSSPGSLTATVTGSPPTTSTFVSGLTNGVAYRFTVRATNAYGTSVASAPSNTVTPQSLAPEITAAPLQAVVAGHTLGANPNLALLIRVTWATRAGASAICSETLQRSIDGGSWTTISLPSPTAQSATDTIPTVGDVLVYRIQATGCNGAASPVVAGNTFTYNLAEENNARWAYSGASQGWQIQACTACAGGYARYTVLSGAAATFSSGPVWSLGLVLATGPAYGSADVYVDGSLAAVVNAHAATAGNRTVEFAFGSATLAPHNIRVVNLATAGHPRLAVDAMAAV